MHTAFYAHEIPSIGTKRNDFLTAILEQKAKKYAVAVGGKRNCPFAAPAIRQRARHSDDDFQALQHDVEDLEANLAAACRRTKSQNKAVDTNCVRSVLEALRDAGMGFAGLQSCGQLEFDPIVDAPVFRQMEKSVSEQYDQLAQVFRDAGLEGNQTDLCDAHVITGDQQGTFVRFTTTRVAPFGLDVVSGAMWNAMKKSSVLNMGVADSTIDSGEDSVVYLKRDCLLQDDAAGATGIPVLLRGVCRRFVEPHRIVLVWEGMGDWPKDHLRSHPGSVPIRERGYCVVKNLQSDDVKGRRAAPLISFQTCVCMTPGLSADIDMNEPECLRILSNVVIPSYRKILDAREQALENYILDEMIHAKRHGSDTRIL